jgi:AhpD family alkylhydroperoxidase
MDSAKETREKLRGPARELRNEIPDVLKAFGELARAATADGELDTRTKEFAALAIAISKQCDGCVVAHLRNLVRLGATKRQVAEICGVAILMDGGPGTVWGPRALAAYDEIVAERSEVSGPSENK